MGEEVEGVEPSGGYDNGDDPITLPGERNVPTGVVVVLIFLVAVAVGGVLFFLFSNGQEPTIECPAPKTVSETLECLENSPRANPSPSPMAAEFLGIFR